MSGCRGSRGTVTYSHGNSVRHGLRGFTGDNTMCVTGRAGVLPATTNYQLHLQQVQLQYQQQRLQHNNNRHHQQQQQQQLRLQHRKKQNNATTCNSSQCNDNNTGTNHMHINNHSNNNSSENSCPDNNRVPRGTPAGSRSRQQRAGRHHARVRATQAFKSGLRKFRQKLRPTTQEIMGHVNQENASATQHNQSAHLKVAARE